MSEGKASQHYLLGSSHTYRAMALDGRTSFDLTSLFPANKPVATLRGQLLAKDRDELFGQDQLAGYAFRGFQSTDCLGDSAGRCWPGKGFWVHAEREDGSSFYPNCLQSDPAKRKGGGIGGILAPDLLSYKWLNGKMHAPLVFCSQRMPFMCIRDPEEQEPAFVAKVNGLGNSAAVLFGTHRLFSGDVKPDQACHEAGTGSQEPLLGGQYAYRAISVSSANDNPLLALQGASSMCVIC
jgi:hypothetical protein